MKLVNRNGISTAVASIAILGLAAVQDAKADALRVGSQFPGTHSSSIALKGAADDIAKETNNRVTFTLYTDSKLGGAFEVIDQVRTGQVDIDVSGPEWYGRLVPDLQVLDLPFLINSYKQAYCMIDGQLGKSLEEKVAQKNLVVLGWMVNGFRHVTNNARPLKSPNDIAGLKIRTPPSNIYLDTFKALGASPTPIDIKELYQALQQNVVDGQENPYDNIAVRRFNEVQKHLSNTGHFFAWTWLVANKRSYEKLSQADRKSLHAVLDKHIAVQRQQAAQLAEDSKKQLVAAGMTYTEIPAADFVAFRSKVAPVYDKIRQSVAEPIYTMANSAADQCKGS